MSRFTSKYPRPGLAAGWGEQKGDQKSLNHSQGALGTLICLEEIPARLQDPHTIPLTPGPAPAPRGTGALWCPPPARGAPGPASAPRTPGGPQGSQGTPPRGQTSGFLVLVKG